MTRRQSCSWPGTALGAVSPPSSARLRARVRHRCLASWGVSGQGSGREDRQCSHWAGFHGNWLLSSVIAWTSEVTAMPLLGRTSPHSLQGWLGQAPSLLSGTPGGRGHQETKLEAGKDTSPSALRLHTGPEQNWATVSHIPETPRAQSTEMHTWLPVRRALSSPAPPWPSGWVWPQDSPQQCPVITETSVTEEPLSQRDSGLDPGGQGSASSCGACS